MSNECPCRTTDTACSWPACPPNDPRARTCAHCGTAFRVRKPSDPKRFCKHACAYAAQRAAADARQRTCEYCGAEFAVDLPSTRRTYCGRACANAAQRGPGDTKRRCAHCGSAFTVRRPSARQTYCGQDCAYAVRGGSDNARWRDGRRSHPLYATWHNMIRRCHDLEHLSYPNYGQRGITVCREWRNDFWVFVAAVGSRPDGHTLDRIDNDGNYEPGNVRWATASEQRANQRPRKRVGAP